MKSLTCVLFIGTTISYANAFLPSISKKNVNYHRQHHPSTKSTKFSTSKNIANKTSKQESSIEALHVAEVPGRGGAGAGAGAAAAATETHDALLDIPRIGITIGCTFLTWFIQRQYTNVMASSALTLICCMCLNKRLSQAAFCGTFAGMASMNIIPSWQYALGLGTVTSSLYEILIEKRNAFVGIGGRLGATAFIASLVIAIIQGTPMGISSSSFASLSGSISGIDNLKKSVILSMTFWHAVGSVGTIILREKGDDTTAKDPIRASAIVGLIGALFLQDRSAALAVYGGSFVGMSAPNRLLNGILPNQMSKNGQQQPQQEIPKITRVGLFAAFAIAGAMGGIIHGTTIELGWFNGGWGGKAGFCGFLGCLVYRGISTVKHKII